MTPLIFVGIGLVMSTFIFVLAGYCDWRMAGERKKRRVEKPVAPKLSWPARQIVKDYFGLPAEHRPWSDIESIVRALDVKYGLEKIERHMAVGGYSSYKTNIYTWSCCFNIRNDCPVKAYHEIHNEINSIHNAIKDREHELKVAEVQGDLDDVQQLLSSLGEEAKVINEGTESIREITGASPVVRRARDESCACDEWAGGKVHEYDCHNRDKIFDL